MEDTSPSQEDPYLSQGEEVQSSVETTNGELQSMTAPLVNAAPPGEDGSSASAPSSAPLSTTTGTTRAVATLLPGTQNGEQRVQIRFTHPQLPGQAPRAFHIDRAAGQVRLDMGRGNMVTIPLQQPTPRVIGPSAPPPANPDSDAAAADTISPVLPRSAFPLPGQVASAIVPVADGTSAAAAAHSAGSQQPVVLPTVNLRVGLQPLRPTPVLTPRSSAASQHSDDDDESLNRFKCTVCYEFMKDPVGCPSTTCSSRFCRHCFVRAARESSNNTTQQRQSPSTGIKAKCPTCRVEFTHYVPDEALKKEMEEGPRVACRHEGCPESSLGMADLQNHERQCNYEHVQCRYASFGCPWKGRRGDIDSHEGTDCNLHKVHFLVDRFRKLEMDHNNRISVLQQQNAAALQMLHVYRQNAQHDLMKSTTNLFDLLQYVHVVSCCTNHFLQTKERWHPLFRSNEGRGAVANFLILLPTGLVCAVMALKCVLVLPQFNALINHTGMDNSASEAALEIMLKDSITGALIGLMSYLTLVANFVDSKSSIEWGSFALPGVGSPPVMCNLMALCLFTMHMTSLDSLGFPYQSIMMWVIMSLATTFFPALILTMSHDSARGLTSSPTPSVMNIGTKARSLEPVLYGLRFSVIAVIFGILPTLDSAALLLLSRPLWKHPKLAPIFGTKNCFLEGLNGSFLATYLCTRVAMTLVQIESWDEFEVKLTIAWKDVLFGGTSIADDSFLWSLLESVLAFAVLLMVSAWLNAGLMAGTCCGHIIIQIAEKEVAANRRLEGTEPGKDYQLLGLVTFGVWVGLCGILLSTPLQ